MWKTRLLAGLVLVLGISGTCVAAEWGNLSGKFVYEGKAPTPEKLQITKDVEVCSKYQDEIVDQSLLVGADGGISGVFIWLRVPQGKKIDIHPDLIANAEKNPTTIDNLHCMFNPHTACVWGGKQKLLVKNSDPIAQVVKIDFNKNSAVNATMAVGGNFEAAFPVAERLPAPVTCGIHPWASGYLFVSDTPYATTTDKDGNFTIPNLPAGTWEFQAWHERRGYLTADPKWKGGRFSFTVKSGDNSLGTIKVTPAALEKKN